MANDDLYLIKRYSNRKLYDSVLRRFTTLDDIAKLIESGVSVVVRDHASGEDRTHEVLAQVVGRRARSVRGSSSDASDLLTGLLRGPAGIARTVVDQLAPVDDRTPEPDPTAESEPDPTPETEPGSGAGPEGRGQDEEIRELRDQVSQLTEAVTLLLKEQAAQRAQERDDDA